MVTKKYTINELNIADIFTDVPYSPYSLQFMDIETTGLSRSRDIVYLISFAEIVDNSVHLVQGFCESYEEEKELLSFFEQEYSKEKLLVTYNGNGFDIPFLKERFQKYNVFSPIDENMSLDLLDYVKANSKGMQLINHRQKTLEAFFQISREDQFSGKELISLYRSYLKSKDGTTLDKICLHNFEDVKNLIQLFRIYHLKRQYDDVRSNLAITDLQLSINSYTTFDKCRASEYLIDFSLSMPLPHALSVIKDGLFLNISDNRGKLSLQKKNLDLFYYIKNYKDYYYLLDEDTCVHKDLGIFVDSSHRKKATPYNCRVAKHGVFIPILCEKFDFNGNDVKTYRDDFKSSDYYIEYNSEYFDSEQTTSYEFLTQYITASIRSLL